MERFTQKLLDTISQSSRSQSRIKTLAISIDVAEELVRLRMTPDTEVIRNRSKAFETLIRIGGVL